MSISSLMVGAPHNVGYIGAGKGCGKGAASRPEGEQAAYVGRHFGSGRGGEGEHRSVGQHLAQAAYLEIGGAEVVAPLRDAMGFVDHYQAHVEAAELGGKSFAT